MSVFPSASGTSAISWPISTGVSRRPAQSPRPPDPAAGRGREAHPVRRLLRRYREPAMSIALPAGLPARPTLLAEGIEVLDRDQVRSWGRRPLRLCLVNLMPNKAVTETQVARLLGATSIPVELTLCLPDGYRSKSTPADHMAL